MSYRKMAKQKRGDAKYAKTGFIQQAIIIGTAPGAGESTLQAAQSSQYQANGMALK